MNKQTNVTLGSVFIAIIITIIIVGLKLWYIAIIAFVIWYLYKKDKRFSPKIKLISSVAISLVFLSLWGITIYSERTPSLIISEPETGISVQAKTISIKGRVSPSNSQMTVNGLVIETKQGSFNYEFHLQNTVEKNNIVVEAKNHNKKTNKTLTITRIFTEEEKLVMEETKIKAQQVKDAELAKQKAEQVAYDKSPAGVLCKKHSKWPETEEWSRVDCERALSGEVWIGMNPFLLIAKRGNPDSNNKSNYGSGDEYQFCWHDLSPSCVYVKEPNSLIYSYN